MGHIIPLPFNNKKMTIRKGAMLLSDPQLASSEPHPPFTLISSCRKPKKEALFKGHTACGTRTHSSQSSMNVRNAATAIFFFFVENRFQYHLFGWNKTSRLPFIDYFFCCHRNEKKADLIGFEAHEIALTSAKLLTYFGLWERDSKQRMKKQALCKQLKLSRIMDYF